MKCLVYAALREDVNSGWAWIDFTKDSPKFRQRAIFWIKKIGTRKKIYCEVLNIDNNFLNYYNKKGEGRKISRKI